MRETSGMHDMIEMRDGDAGFYVIDKHDGWIKTQRDCDYTMNKHKTRQDQRL